MNSAVTLPQWLQTSRDSYAGMASPHVPSWYTDFCHQQWHTFLQHGLPNRHDERWKYADLSFLANKNYSAAQPIEAKRLRNAINQHRLQRGDAIMLVVVNGYFMQDLSDLAKLPPHVTICNFREAFEKHPDLIKHYWPTAWDAKKYPFASLNAAMSQDGLFIHLAKQCELTLPIHLISLVTDDREFITHPQQLIILEEQSKLTLVEEHYAASVEQAYLINMVSSINLGKSAKLAHYKIQQGGKLAVQMAQTFIQQQQDSELTWMNFSLGSLFARDDLTATLQEKGARCNTIGFYHLRDHNQYIDNHIDINHAAAHTNSEMLFKGILNNKARAVFNGRLHVEKDAQKILAYQANHNLLLSNEAEVYSKPELEIYADDVKCKHGATTGQLDQDALFYLRARGIEKLAAMNMLLEGFVEEIMQYIAHPGIKMRVQEVGQL